MLQGMISSVGVQKVPATVLVRASGRWIGAALRRRRQEGQRHRDALSRSAVTLDEEGRRARRGEAAGFIVAEGTTSRRCREQSPGSATPTYHARRPREPRASRPAEASSVAARARSSLREGAGQPLRAQRSTRCAAAVLPRAWSPTAGRDFRAQANSPRDGGGRGRRAELGRIMRWRIRSSGFPYVVFNADFDVGQPDVAQGKVEGWRPARGSWTGGGESNPAGGGQAQWEDPSRWQASEAVCRRNAVRSPTARARRGLKDTSSARGILGTGEVPRALEARVIGRLGYLDIDEQAPGLMFQLGVSTRRQRSTVSPPTSGMGSWAKVFGRVTAGAIADGLPPLRDRVGQI